MIQKIHDKLDVDGDGDVDLSDAMAALEKWNRDNGVKKLKYQCVECGKGMKKKSKYGTQVCVECYRNPSDEMRCISTVSSGDRCKRRKHTDSILGYCGIHMKKHSEPLPFKEEQA
jgi:protein-arginine kinase activator protein McsA